MPFINDRREVLIKQYQDLTTAYNELEENFPQQTTGARECLMASTAEHLYEAALVLGYMPAAVNWMAKVVIHRDAWANSANLSPELRAQQSHDWLTWAKDLTDFMQTRETKAV